MTPVNHPLSPLMNRPRITASDRLEADKAKYVKSPQVIHRRQNPAIGTLLSPVLTRKQNPSLYSANSTTESSSTEYDFTSQFSSGKLWLTSQQKDFNDCLHQVAKKPGSQSPVHTFISGTVTPQGGNLSSSIRKHEHHSEAYKDNTLSLSRTQPMSHSFLTSNQGNDPQPPPNCSVVSPLCRKRFSGRRLNRPDSLIMYRQKRDEASSSKENEEAGLVIRFLQGTPLLRRSARFSQNQQPQSCTGNVPVSPKLQKSREEPGVCQTTCIIRPDTQEIAVNDKLMLADAQKFFESCGLEGSLLNLLDMYQKGEEHTPFGSMESMDRVSCGFAAVDEEKAERTPVSVIERNARVIKWIYSCQRARTNESHEHKQTPRESTV